MKIGHQFEKYVKHPNTQFFIRRGRWCECLRSANSRTGEIERGVSVYEAELDADGKTFVAKGHAWNKINNKTAEQIWLAKPKPWFLLSGIPMIERGTGDQEPLLSKDIVLVAELERIKGNSTFKILKMNPPLKFDNHQGFEEGKCVAEQNAPVVQNSAKDNKRFCA